MILRAIADGAFFVGGCVVWAVGVFAVAFTGWCNRWPRGMWK